jgi:hypothetical protein
MKNLLLLTFFGLFGFSAGAQDTLGCDLIASFTYTVSGETLYLTNTSTDEPVWSFYDYTVDGLSSSLENPTFPTTDFETSELVCLTVYDSTEECIDTYCLTIFFEDDTIVDDTTGCELVADFTYTVSGGLLYLTNTSTGEPLWPFYSWMVDGLTSSLENPTFSTADFEASEEVCLTVYDSLEDCMDTYCLTIYFEDDTLVDDSTECELIANFTYTISGGMLNLTNTSTGEPFWPFYSWMVDGLTSSLENPSFPTADFEATEEVCLTVYDSLEDCMDTYCLTIYLDDDTTTVECELEADFSFSYEDGELTLTNTSTGEFGTTTYDWNVDGMWSSDENPTFPTADFEESEVICLTVYSIDSLFGCIDTVCYTFFFDDSTGVDSTAGLTPTEKLTVEIYPNPAKDALNIRLANGNGNQQIIIYNTVGEMVRMDQVGLNNSQTTIDVSDLPNGLYIINVIDAENPANSIQEKFIKN